jgi:hypothetical protein
MLRSCIICRAGATPDLQLQYCSVCQSALYCSRACQREDWKKQHKKICKFLNVGHGDMQVRHELHMSQAISWKEAFERRERFLDEDDQRYFKLFQESTFEGSRAAALEMKKLAERMPKKENQEFMLYQSLYLLVHSSRSEMLSWPNSPLLVMLQFVDANMLYGVEEVRETPLHYLADLADFSDYSTHVNQLILAKQLIKHGAIEKNVSIPHGKTPLHMACSGTVVTNLDFVQVLLEEGADPNAQDHLGWTPLMCTMPDAPGAAKFLLNWPTTDCNITLRSGESFPTRVRHSIKYFSDFIALPDNPEQLQHQFLLQQWREIEDMLVERGAYDTGIAMVE